VGRDDLRVRRIKQYVLARLREELQNAPRGSQARLAKRLGVSGAHLSNMLSSTPSRQPGEDFRRKVAAHWGVTYAQLEALALGEESGAPQRSPLPPNLEATSSAYVWRDELPARFREVVQDQARALWAACGEGDLPEDEWKRVLAGLEGEALAHLARQSGDRAATRKRRRPA